MKHLRDGGIVIGGSAQKRRLKNIGYYHGYKGYRFAGNASNRLPLTAFSQVAALYDFDTQLKALFYPRIMSIETALKNYTLEAVLGDANSAVFEDIWRRSLTDYRSYTGRTYRKAWETRQRLRSEIDGIIYGHRGRDVIGHFRDADKDIPIWAIFEVMTLGNFGSFYDCLDRRVKTVIVRDLGMPTNLDSERRLKEIVFALKDFRNAIAHNGVVLDVRFQSGAVNTGVPPAAQAGDRRGQDRLHRHNRLRGLTGLPDAAHGLHEDRVQAADRGLRGDNRALPGRAAHQRLLADHQDYRAGKVNRPPTVCKQRIDVGPKA